MKYLARISYNGSKYLGFQRLNNGQGVQNVLEKVLSKIANEKVMVYGAGRTDAGVHAFDQCIHFEMDNDISIERLKYIMNRMLPSSVKVNSLQTVNSSFHARFSVKEKTYLYKVYVGEKDVFLEDFFYHLSKVPNLKKMKKCCEIFVGTHNFENFVSGKRDNYTSSIHSIKIYKRKNYIYFELKGKSFYRYMVRSIVGAIISVGLEKNTLEEVEEAIEIPLKKKQFLVVPPIGLYLMKIKY